MVSRRAQRVAALAGALAQNGVLRLREAAAMLGVSEMTVRRDIALAPERFAYLGGHIVAAADIGGAAYELDREADSHAAAKAAACAHALALIAADDTIFIDCGTTLAHLAAQLPADLPLTVICYALNVAERLAKKANVRMIMLGGLYHPASASFGGDDAAEALGRFGINKAFISAGGVDAVRGVGCSHLHEVPIKQRAIAAAIESHLVVDSSKLGRVRPALFARIEDFRSLITEDGVRELAAPARQAM